MVRFIVLSFAFLGWCFFEMSGGTDFDGEELRLSRLDAVEQTPLTRAPQTLLAGIDAQSPQVTRAALSLTATQLVDAPEIEAAAPVAVQIQPAAATQPERKTVKFEGSTRSTASLETGADSAILENPTVILPSLVTAATPAAYEVASSVTDVRAVSGNRVNVRGGPGKTFSVVNRLTRGTKVEILQDNGDGWVKLRPVGGGTVGWMADFLLTNG